MARMRLDTLAGETFLRQDEGVPEQGARLSLVTCGEELARLLDGALACSFSHEEPEQADEGSAVEGFLRDCAEFCDVTGLPEPLRLEMEEYFGQRLDALWRLDWLVFGGTCEAVLEPGEPPLAGRTVTLCLARSDSPSVQMDSRLRRSLERFRTAMARVHEAPDDEEDSGGGPGSDSGGGLLH
ncbi:hypothetical protein D187_005003 [Cystobacter fuscus DSM 2262]|uniref:Uncharacterized protein n=2 Tax=Cystobacter fuscus TaxID=43 RepID=S9R4N4_CYSF2|nr:hypothetical protein D187_005003 [Cystobacter fuscus DSM 2262]